MKAFVVVVTVAAAACAGAAPSAVRSGDADAFVAAHNAVRAGAQPAPSPPLPDLTWSDDLAKVAQDWSARCVFEHSHNQYGENLFWFSGDASTPKDVVDGWASEAQFYDLDTNACQPNQECGHYTQLVWRDTARVGCGASKCHLFGDDGVLWVCNYDPPGNVIGQHPY